MFSLVVSNDLAMGQLGLYASQCIAESKFVFPLYKKISVCIQLEAKGAKSQWTAKIIDSSGLHLWQSSKSRGGEKALLTKKQF